MTKPNNPIYSIGDSASGIFHAGEAPPAGHAFFPMAHCGQAMVGEVFTELPKGADLCATDAKWLGIKQDTSAKETPTEKPATDS